MLSEKDREWARGFNVSKENIEIFRQIRKQRRMAHTEFTKKTSEKWMMMRLR